MSERLAWFVVIIVSVAWFATTVILPAAVKDYAAPPEINTVMGIVAGSAVAYVFSQKSKKNHDGQMQGNGRGVEELAIERGRKARRKGRGV